MQLYSADDNQRIQGFDKLLHCPTDLLGSSTLPSTTTSRISTITDPPQKKLNISP